MSMHDQAVPNHANAYAKSSSIAAVAIALAIVMVGLKAYLYYTTGASSFMASLLDSIMDVGLSTMTYLGVRWAAKPADENHRFGYGKMEALIGFLQSLFVGIAALTLAWQVGARLAYPQLLHTGYLDIGLTALIFVTSIVLIRLQADVVSETGSLAIRGDLAHYSGDMLSHGALLALLIISMFTQIPWLDPLLTAVISFTLLRMAAIVCRDSISTLLDREVEGALRVQLLKVVKESPGVAGVHDFRAIQSGQHLIISFDIMVDGRMSLQDAHNICRLVENALLEVVPGAEIMIHVDPIGEIEDSRHQRLEPHHFS
jgi:ferrous-iron efflux pump FieF